jgi:hypothetical protein
VGPVRQRSVLERRARSRRLSRRPARTRNAGLHPERRAPSPADCGLASRRRANGKLLQPQSEMVGVRGFPRLEGPREMERTRYNDETSAVLCHRVVKRLPPPVRLPSWSPRPC